MTFPVRTLIALAFLVGIVFLQIFQKRKQIPRISFAHNLISCCDTVCNEYGDASGRSHRRLCLGYDSCIFIGEYSNSHFAGDLLCKQKKQLS